MASRSLAVSTAAARFDALLDAARTTAREIDQGATITFVPDPYGDGFVAQLYRNRPSTGALETTTFPILNARVSITEATLGAPNFALAIHSNGTIAGIPSYAVGTTPAAETACPGTGAYHLVFSYAGARAERFIPCTVPVATTGTVAYTSPTPATTPAPPTPFPCAGPCVPTAPASPNPTVTCPPRYLAENASTCVPSQLTVSPTSLSFAAPGVPPSQTFVATELGYSGPFTTTDTCSGGTSYSTSGGGGPTATYTVSAIRAETCGITVYDIAGDSATVRVLTQQSLVKIYVCDPRNPARSYGTAIGPDPDGIHEDYSDGTTCASTPVPTSTPASLGTASHAVAPACTQIFEDDWQCTWDDSYSVTFDSSPGDQVRVTATVTPAATVASVTMTLEYWTGSTVSSVPVIGSLDSATGTYTVNRSVVLPASSSAPYTITASVTCLDNGYAQPQGTQCLAGTDLFLITVVQT